MKAITVLWTILLSLFVAVFPGSSHAVTNLTATIQGVQLYADNCAGYPGEVIVSNCDKSARDYGGFTIAAKDANVGPATVKAVDGAADKIVLENALIKATQSAVNGQVTYLGQFASPPDAPPTVRFERSASGTMKRGLNAALDNTFTVTGWVEGNEVATPETKKVTCLSLTNGCGTINLTKTEDSSTLSGNREIKTQFSFYMKNTNDVIELPSYVHVRNVPVGGGAGGPDDISDREGVTEGSEEHYVCQEKKDGEFVCKKKGKGKK